MAASTPLSILKHPPPLDTLFIYKTLVVFYPYLQPSPLSIHIASICFKQHPHRLKLLEGSSMAAATTIGCHAISRVCHRRKSRRCAVGRTMPMSVQRKVRELQRLVPGGRQLSADQLFLRTADYIFQLRFQMHVLKALFEMYMP